MKKIVIIGIVAGGILSFFLVLNSLGLLMFFNSTFSGTPDASCKADTDCAIKHTTCGQCDCGSAVNKDWNEWCPFNNRGIFQHMCEACQPSEQITIRCVEGVCKKVTRLQD